MLRVVERQKAFYFSYDLDLTKRLQVTVNEKLAAAPADYSPGISLN